MIKGLVSRYLGAVAGVTLLVAPLASVEARHHHAKSAQESSKHEKAGHSRSERAEAKHGKSARSKHEQAESRHSKKSGRDKAEKSLARSGRTHVREAGKAEARVALRANTKAPAPAKALETEFDSFFTTTQKVAAAQPAKRPAASAARPAIVPLLALPQPRPSYASPFEASIASLADGSQGRIGVAAIDLKTGRSVSVLGDQPFPMASTSKVAIVATYLAGVDAGRFTLDQRLPLMVPVSSRRWDGDSAPVRPGADYPAISLIEMAITHSDNHATDALLAAVGGPSAVTRWVQSTAGIGEFRLDRTIATLVRDDGRVNPATMIDRRDSVTPLAMVRLLSGLHDGKWLSPQSREVLMGAMSRTVTGRHRIKALLPEGAQVAHKTGTLSNTASDIGFIRTADGRELALAIYVTGQGSKAGRDARIASLARAIYDGYETDSPGDRRAALR